MDKEELEESIKQVISELEYTIEELRSERNYMMNHKFENEQRHINTKIGCIEPIKWKIQAILD